MACNIEGGNLRRNTTFVDLAEGAVNPTVDIETEDYQICCSFLSNLFNVGRLMRLTFLILATLYTAYVFVYSNLDKEELLIVGFLYAGVILYILNHIQLYKRFIYKYVEIFLDIFQETIYRDILNSIIMAAILSFIVYLCSQNLKRVYALCSMTALLLISFILNIKHVANIPWNVVLRSLNLQFIIATLLFYFPYGREFIIYLGRGIVEYLKFSEVGATFVYGNMLMDQFIFAFYILSAIYLSLMTISILRHIGFLDYVIGFSDKLSFLIGITSIEGVFGIVNIFLSMTETCVVVRNNLEKLTKSELFSLMVTGLSTISFTALFGYVSLGANIDYLLISSIISIPCSFAFSKIYLPVTNEVANLHETCPLQQSDTTFDDNNNNNTNGEEIKKNVLDKCVDAIVEANFIVQMIIGNIIAIMSFVSFVDKFIELLVRPFVVDMGLFKFFSFVVAYIVPVLGVDPLDAKIIAEMFVKKILVNEFVAFEILGKNIENFASERSIAIANFLVCGFGNISAAGMLTSIICSITNFKVNTSSMMVKSLFVACIVNIYCACTISILID